MDQGDYAEVRYICLTLTMNQVQFLIPHCPLNTAGCSMGMGRKHW